MLPYRPRDFRKDGQGPFAGRLFVLTDRNVASSGETFTAYVRQVPGAILLGENTMGCASYGNADIRKELPNSGIRVRFGYMKYFINDLLPFREGVGILPQYWLDGVSPEDAIQRLLRG
jgi:C-terminal processing protease CtpA/Prc